MSIIAQGQASRQAYISAVTFVAPGAPCVRAGEVDPSALKFRWVRGLKPCQGEGIWLNCEFEYNGPRGMYVLEAALLIGSDMELTGQVFLRSCTCRDFDNRDQQGRRGEARLCKHLVALRARVLGHAEPLSLPATLPAEPGMGFAALEPQRQAAPARPAVVGLDVSDWK